MTRRIPGQIIDQPLPDGTILRSVVHQGTLTLSPPGIELIVAELFAAA